MHTLILGVKTEDFWSTLAELGQARVKVLLNHYKRMHDGRWQLRLVGPQMALTGYALRIMNKQERDPWTLSQEQREALCFEELQFPIYPFVTAIQAHIDGFIPSVDGELLYRHAIKKLKFQLELRPDSTIAVRAAAVPGLTDNIKHFRKDYRELLSVSA